MTKTLSPRPRLALLASAAAGMSLLAVASAIPAFAAGGEAIHIEPQRWSFSGPFGKFDQGQLQRGFKIYKEVCSQCHGLKRIRFRELGQKGGTAFPPEQIEALAASYEIEDGVDGNGKPIKRPGKPFDAIPSKYKTEAEARATFGGALPPDLSVIARARGIDRDAPFYMTPVNMARDIFTGYQEAGADYVYALLTSYADPPRYKADDKGKLQPVPKGAPRDRTAVACVTVDKGEGAEKDTCNKLSDGMNYNTTFPGHQIAMAEPLQAGLNMYVKEDGSPETVEQYARDVTAFLTWASDPKMEDRKSMGVLTLLYLLITAVLLYLAKVRMWSRIKH